MTIFFIIDSNQNGPRLLWSLYYNITSTIVAPSDGATHLPTNVHIVSDPDATVGYETCVKEAKDTFYKICPNEEFLPKIPDPEDIVYETDIIDENDNNENEEQEPEVTNNEICHFTNDECQEREQ